MKEKKEYNFKYVIIVIFTILILTILVILLYSKMIINMKFDNFKIQNFAEENSTPIFKISKIILYSNVDIVDESENNSLQDINISQYTDIAVYIDNKLSSNELTNENTIKEMYIDNINISTLSSNGEKILNYKNSYLFGKYRSLDVVTSRIYFDILNENKQNTEEIYDIPTFYTDCSNPITLGYINKNVVTNYRIRINDKSITFDGALLKKANIALDVLNNKINFGIHIKNNLDEQFVCNVSIDNNLESEDGGLYTGSVMKIFEFSENEHKFIKLTT